eukprot:5941881-Amphidinium_carterae.1
MATIMMFSEALACEDLSSIMFNQQCYLDGATKNNKNNEHRQIYCHIHLCMQEAVTNLNCLVLTGGFWCTLRTLVTPGR